VVGGVVVAADAADVRKLTEWANVIGVGGAPFDSYLTLRGLRTLFPRIEAQQRSTASLANLLRQHPRVRAVHYPGLETHPGHTIAKSQQAGFGAMLSFDLRGDIEDVRHFVESSMSHDARREAGIGDTLLRLSVGLEAEDDLRNDLRHGFSVLGETTIRHQLCHDGRP